MVQEYNPNTITDTQVAFREHHPASHAKLVSSSQLAPIIDKDDKNRSLKPTSVTLAGLATGGFDLAPNSAYRYIATGSTNVLLASEAGYTPDVNDLYIPANEQFMFHTGSQWRRLEVFSTPGAVAQVVKVK